MTSVLSGDRQSDIRAAIAEALYVDGKFDMAAELWTNLANESFAPQESTLKASMAAFASGRATEGWNWLARAEAAGANADDVWQVAALVRWNSGQCQRAVAEMRQGTGDETGRSAFRLTSLGAALWQTGRRAQARQCFAEALARDPADPFALLNLAAADLAESDRTAVYEKLTRAARHLPHRPEPYVFYSRLCNAEQQLKRAREALVRARLRIRNLATDEMTVLSHPDVMGTADVTGTIRTDAVSLCVRYCLDSGQQVPSVLAMNSGYRAAFPGFQNPRPARTGSVAAGLRGLSLFRLPVKMWRNTSRGRELEVEVSGLPIPPCVRLDHDWFELGSESGWLPLPSPAGLWNWTIRIETAPEFVIHRSTEEPTKSGVTLIALRKTNHVNVPAIRGDEQVQVIGHESLETLRRAGKRMAEAFALWSGWLETKEIPSPPVLVLNRPNSSFCYCRPGFIRLASGVLANDHEMTLLYHEAGHRWWGTHARFSPDEQWLAEALAEYSLHLAEEAGLLPGHSSGTVATLKLLRNGVLPNTGLARLGKRRGPSMAYYLRAKGGFVISMLGRIIGREALRRTLIDALEYGMRCPLNSYVLFALASRHHGASLNWFVNQWINLDAAMRLSVRGIEVARVSGGFRTRFDAHCHGWAIPGAPVDILVRAGGEERRVTAELNLGHDRVETTTAERPVSLIIDPDYHWYANVPQRVVRIPS